jgi:hypothetical protein
VFPCTILMAKRREATLSGRPAPVEHPEIGT